MITEIKSFKITKNIIFIKIQYIYLKKNNENKIIIKNKI